MSLKEKFILAGVAVVFVIFLTLFFNVRVKMREREEEMKNSSENQEFLERLESLEQRVRKSEKGRRIRVSPRI